MSSSSKAITLRHLARTQQESSRIRASFPQFRGEFASLDGKQPLFRTPREIKFNVRSDDLEQRFGQRRAHIELPNQLLRKRRNRALASDRATSLLRRSAEFGKDLHSQRIKDVFVTIKAGNRDPA